MHQIRRTQKIPIPVEQAWEFFSNPDNLAQVTPPYMNFKILSRSDAGEMYPGMIITYHISPLLNIKIKWATEISQIKEYKYFIDNQITGPYKIWHHEHRFTKTDDGIEMKDILFYEIKYGFLGRLVNKLYIKKRVEDIFNYREIKIKELFGSV